MREAWLWKALLKSPGDEQVGDCLRQVEPGPAARRLSPRPPQPLTFWGSGTGAQLQGGGWQVLVLLERRVQRDLVQLGLRGGQVCGWGPHVEEQSVPRREHCQLHAGEAHSSEGVVSHNALQERPRPHPRTCRRPCTISPSLAFLYRDVLGCTHSQIHPYSSDPLWGEGRSPRPHRQLHARWMFGRC